MDTQVTPFCRPVVTVDRNIAEKGKSIIGLIAEYDWIQNDKYW